MRRRARRVGHAPRLETLELRALLSAGMVGVGPSPFEASGKPGSVLVRFLDGAPAAAVDETIRSLGATVERAFPDGPSLLRLGAGVTVESAVARLQSSRLVAYAEPDALLRTTAVTTNDPYLGRLWGLNNSNDVDIDAPEAWGITMGTPSTLVAVIDTGLDLANTDLVSRAYVNPGEIAGNGVDDDANGYIDDIHGWNFDANNSNVQDDNGHGTHVAGIIGAAANNGYGVVGVNWNARILAVKTLDADGSGTTSAAIAGIRYAVDRGAKVINASWGGGPFSQGMLDAIRYARSRGTVFVAAAGNDGISLESNREYPASYREPNMLSVAAIDSSGALASYSNYGPTTVDIAAPGSSILSTIDSGRFATYSGTSMATPYVTGVVALLAGYRPDLSADQLVQVVRSSAKALGSLSGKVITGGMVSAYRALVSVGPRANPSAPTVTTPPPASPPGATMQAAPSPGGGALTLTPGGSRRDDVRAAILASDEYFLAAGNSFEGFVSALYRDILGREADASGRAGWVQRIQAGGDRIDVVRGIQGSVEAARIKVATWYIRDLGRPGTLDQLKNDPGVIGWADGLLAGAGEGSTRAAIIGSPEFAAVRNNDAVRIVDDLYRSLLLRPAEAAGSARWVEFLNAGGSVYEIALGIAVSPEANRLLVAGWYRSDLKRTTPLDALRNDPGVIGWADLIAPA